MYRASTALPKKMEQYPATYTVNYSERSCFVEGGYRCFPTALGFFLTGQGDTHLSGIALLANPLI